MAQQFTRRKFLKKAALTTGSIALPYYIPAKAAGTQGNISPSNKITLGMIGTGEHGIEVNLSSFLQQPDAQIVAVCDVDANRMLRAQKIVNDKYNNTDCKAYKDFRDILLRKDIDAVMISTPDHWHVPIAIAAAQMGKDICCEKPTLTVREGRELCQVIRRYGRVFQTSTEDRAIFIFHRIAELVRNGRIGKLHTIRVTLPGGHWARFGFDPMEKPQPVPPHFDYDTWLGPAPYVPYSPARCHWNFRWISDYSGGQLTDWGAHLIDTAQWANNTEHTGPIEIDGRGVFPTEGIYDTAKEFHIEYKYANDVNMIVDSGGIKIRCEGSDGWVENLNWAQNLTASSQDILDSVIGPEELHLYTCTQGEHRNFLDCVKSRRDPYFPVEIGHRCCSVMHLGNISMLLGRKLKWDPDKENFVNDPQADRMLSRAKRAKWAKIF